jgi:hypothetical protein
MNELEQALVALGRELELPAAPDVSTAVRARLGEPRRPRRLLLAAAVALLVAIGVAFAVPPARAAILRFFHLGGATVTIVERLPPARIRAGLPGTPARLGEAPFRVLLPDGQRPDGVRRDGGTVWLRYGPPGRPRLLVAETRTGGPWLFKKVAAADTTVRPTQVEGRPALWIAGARHQLRLPLPGGGVHLAGNTLLWQQGALTLRLEADVGLERARQVAAAFD